VTDETSAQTYYTVTHGTSVTPYKSGVTVTIAAGDVTGSYTATTDEDPANYLSAATGGSFNSTTATYLTNAGSFSMPAHNVTIVDGLYTYDSGTTYVAAGDEVTLTKTANAYVQIQDATDQSVVETMLAPASGSVTFTMPSKNVTVVDGLHKVTLKDGAGNTIDTAYSKTNGVSLSTLFGTKLTGDRTDVDPAGSHSYLANGAATVDASAADVTVVTGYYAVTVNGSSISTGAYGTSRVYFGAADTTGYALTSTSQLTAYLLPGDTVKIVASADASFSILGVNVVGNDDAKNTYSVTVSDSSLTYNIADVI
jgi:hypothetical protein